MLLRRIVISTALLLFFSCHPLFANVQVNKLPDNLYIATFNIFCFGDVESKYSSADEEYDGEGFSGTPQRIKNLANVLSVGNFDLIVIQELHEGEKGEWALSDLEKELNSNHNGHYKHMRSGNIGKGFGMDESIGFLYNPSIVSPVEIPGTTDKTILLPVSTYDGSEKPPRAFVKTKWVSGDFDFTLISAHLEYGNKEKRDAGYQFVQKILEAPLNFSTDPDVIVVGDFNRFGMHSSIKLMEYDPDVFLAPNVLFFDPGFNTEDNVVKKLITGKGIPNNNPQLLSTTVSKNTYVYDIVFMTKDADEEFPATSGTSEYGVDFGIIHFDEIDGFGYQDGTEQLSHEDLKRSYSDHRPLWVRFEIKTGNKDVNAVQYVGTQYGKKFHSPGCRTVQGRDIKYKWDKREDAISTHSPCGLCKP